MAPEAISKLGEKVKKAFGRRLKKARADAGFKHAADFARVLHEEEHTYRSWERGEHLPDLIGMTRLCKLLRVRPDELLPHAVPGPGESGNDQNPRMREAS